VKNFFAPSFSLRQSKLECLSLTSFFRHVTLVAGAAALVSSSKVCGEISLHLDSRH
jgi:hypothetical protein